MRSPLLALCVFTNALYLRGDMRVVAVVVPKAVRLARGGGEGGEELRARPRGEGLGGRGGVKGVVGREPLLVEEGERRNCMEAGVGVVGERSEESGVIGECA